MKIESSIINRIYVAIFTKIINSTYKILSNFSKNISDDRPLELLKVDPSDIQYVSGLRGRSSFENGYWGPASIKDGNWDIGLKKIRYCKEYNKELSSLSKKENLIKDIRKKGYISQRDLFIKDLESVVSTSNDRFHPLFDEITVDVGRDGTLLWRTGGRHRLLICKKLNINHIYVLVRTRHSSWNDIRRQIYEDPDENYNNNLINHPDLSQSKLGALEPV